MVCFIMKALVISFLVSPEIVPFTFGPETVNNGQMTPRMCSVRTGDEPITLRWILKGEIMSLHY